MRNVPNPSNSRATISGFPRDNYYPRQSLYRIENNSMIKGSMELTDKYSKINVTRYTAWIDLVQNCNRTLPWSLPATPAGCRSPRAQYVVKKAGDLAEGIPGKLEVSCEGPGLWTQLQGGPERGSDETWTLFTGCSLRPAGCRCPSDKRLERKDQIPDYRAVPRLRL